MRLFWLVLATAVPPALRHRCLTPPEAAMPYQENNNKPALTDRHTNYLMPPGATAPLTVTHGLLSWKAAVLRLCP